MQAPAPAPAPEQPLSTGLDQPFAAAAGRGTKRPAAKQMPVRMGATWATVTVLIDGREMTTNPHVKCNNCDAQPFAGGIQRIEDHILKKCTCMTTDLQSLRTAIAKKRAEARRCWGQTGGYSADIADAVEDGAARVA